MLAPSSADLWIYLALASLICAFYLGSRLRQERHSVRVREESVRARLTEPPSLHPLIDKNLCIGCGSCAAACPEQNVLGIIAGKAELIAPSHCIGHGACKEACPVGALTLVFGTATRGVDIPAVGPNFESNVPGIFIAGELGGMGLIKNAIEQGKQAMESIAGLDGIASGSTLDVVIIGAGPAGFAASLAAKQRKLRFATIEQESLGGTVAHYPRGKVVMTSPADLPLVGKVRFTETTKEKLLEFWREVERLSDLHINYGERVENILAKGNCFEIKSNVRIYNARAVLLAIGRRGSPRKLGVPGEDLSKVAYRVIDPAEYRGKHVLVCGGGDSALEAATSIADETDTTVTLCYRGEAFSRAKEKNQLKVKEAEMAGLLKLVMKSNVSRIDPHSVRLSTGEETIELQNDAVVVCAGGILPTAFLSAVGIEVETKFGSV